MSPLPPQAEDMEKFVLGSAMLGQDGGALVASVSVEKGLRPEHFYWQRHGLVFEAMLALYDRRDPVDVGTVTAELERTGKLADAGGKAYVWTLPNLVPSAGSHGFYAQRVVHLARMRNIITAARDLADAAYMEDADAIAAAEGRLAKQDERPSGPSIEQRQDDLVAHVERGKVDTIPWPFAKANDMTGGMWRGHLTVLVGHSQHGKSVIADQILETAAKHGERCAAYLTEMTPLERDLRFVARRADLPMKRLMVAKLRNEELPKFVKAVEELQYPLIPAGTRTVADIARDIRRNGWDVALVDLLNAVTGPEVKDIDAQIQMLAGLANDTGCHIIGCNHLNRNRAGHNTYPLEPVKDDIRGSGSIYDLATNVLSIYRHERKELDGTSTGEEGDEAVLNFMKLKNGVKGRINLTFNGNRMRFLPPMDPGTVATAAA